MHRKKCPGNFGRKLRSLRLGAHKTLQDLSDEVGLSVSYLSDIENGNRWPPSFQIQLELENILIDQPEQRGGLVVESIKDTGNVPCEAVELPKVLSRMFRVLDALTTKALD